VLPAGFRIEWCKRETEASSRASRASTRAAAGDWPRRNRRTEPRADAGDGAEARGAHQERAEKLGGAGDGVPAEQLLAVVPGGRGNFLKLAAPPVQLELGWRCSLTKANSGSLLDKVSKIGGHGGHADRRRRRSRELGCEGISTRRRCRRPEKGKKRSWGSSGSPRRRMSTGGSRGRPGDAGMGATQRPACLARGRRRWCPRAGPPPRVGPARPAGWASFFLIFI
jgi:hypothetical protein